jgi:hypothetical protein
LLELATTAARAARPVPHGIHGVSVDLRRPRTLRSGAAALGTHPGAGLRWRPLTRDIDAPKLAGGVVRGWRTGLPYNFVST